MTEKKNASCFVIFVRQEHSSIIDARRATLKSTMFWLPDVRTQISLLGSACRRRKQAAAAAQQQAYAAQQAAAAQAPAPVRKTAREVKADTTGSNKWKLVKQN